MAKRIRRVWSVSHELVKKAREAMLTAVQIYNNPQIEFKSELFIVTTVIAWTYLLHAYFRNTKSTTGSLNACRAARSMPPHRAALCGSGAWRSALAVESLPSTI